jgi:RNA-directed DNA polymerase
MMHGHEKSGDAIVAGKPTNKAERSAAEPVERRAKAKGKANRHGTYRTQRRARVTQVLDRVRHAATAEYRLDPRWEPYAGKPHVRLCAGGAQ